LTDNGRRWRGWLATILFVGGLASLPGARAEDDATSPARVEHVRRQAERLEENGQWLKACELYQQLLCRERNLPEIRDRFLHCLRRAQQLRRHGDLGYRQQVADLSLPVALDVYGELLIKLRASYVDRARTEPEALFRQGLEEFRFALEDEVFCRECVSVPMPAARAFQALLLPTWGARPVPQLEDARSLAREVAQAAQRTLGIRPSLVLLEFACGACCNLDEYTALLTPAEFAEICASLKGEVVGVGLDVVPVGQVFRVSQVLAGSPAEMAGVRTGDQLVRVDRRDVGPLPADAVADLLKGEVGTAVEVEILSPGDSAARTLRLTRQTLPVPSVSEARFVGDRMAGIGYLQIVAFQETTQRELDDALLKLQMAGLRALILDLRGNPGGGVEAAVRVAERFLADGLVASSRGQLRAYNRSYEVHNPAALGLPLVVLIDGGTASAAELLAGALKEHHRATVVGQPSYGKGSVQRHGRVGTAGAGMRVTVARLFSPGGRPYTGTGVTPDVLVERMSPDWSMDVEQDPQVRAAADAARQLLMGR
jgi:carboxyl-terminal processing protease